MERPYRVCISPSVSEDKQKPRSAPARQSFGLYRTFEMKVADWVLLLVSCTLRTMIIKSSVYIISSPGYLECPEPDKPEYAFIGRSNVGKSSLINMLCNNEKLAKTSGTPGKTKLINHFLINGEWYIADMPGYGFAKVSLTQRGQWKKMTEEYLRNRPNLVNVFVLIDARHSPQKNDLEFINELGKWEVPFCLLFTKTDKENQRTVSLNVKNFLDRMRETWQFLPQYFLTSALKKTGRDKILQLIAEMNLEFGDREPAVH